MKINLRGARLGWRSRHSLRALATSGRLCSAACSDFFIRQLKLGQRLAQQPGAGRHLMRLLEPATQLRKRRVRAGQHPRVDRVVQTCQLARHMTALRQSRRHARPPPTAQHLRDVGNTDPQHRGDPANPLTLVSRRQNPLPQILRICLPVLPKHGPLRLDQPETYESHIGPEPQGSRFQSTNTCSNRHVGIRDGRPHNP